ncbi:hypothetical protein VTO73DRAFT_11254 [Trametes versicolor]
MPSSARPIASEDDWVQQILTSWHRTTAVRLSLMHIVGLFWEQRAHSAVRQRHASWASMNLTRRAPRGLSVHRCRAGTRAGHTSGEVA